MFNKRILIAVFVLVSVFVGWKNKDFVVENPKKQANQFVITESFGNGFKSSYKTGNVNLVTGNWTFDNALIGDLPADKKTRGKSARIKTGSIAMNFDIYHINKVIISHAVFGKDANTNFDFLVSVDEGKNYSKIGRNILSTNQIKQDSFLVSAKGKLRIKIVSEGVSRLNICDIVFKGNGDPKIVLQKEMPVVEKKAEPYQNTLSSRKAIRGNDAPPASGENSNMYLGNPSNASSTDPNNYLIDKYYYTISYNRAKGTPNWVSWHLDKSNITAVSGRVNNFAAYSGLPDGWYQVQSNSYAESGFDRGHNCPSGDRTSSRNANLATFLMTNMIPQAPQNNQKPWADFEVYLREQVKKGFEVYIVMGVYGEGGSGSKGGITKVIDEGRVTVPSNIWKVAVVLPEGENDLQRIEANAAKVIAINTPNTNVLALDWRKYLVSVKDIEKATGYNLLSMLSAKIQQEIENKKAINF